MTPGVVLWHMNRGSAAVVAGTRLLGPLVGAGLAGPWACGVLVLAGQVAAGVSGPCAAAALLLAALAAVLAVLCQAEVSRYRHTSMYEASREQLGVRAALLLGWTTVTWRVGVLAACARGLGATVDYIAAGRVRATARLWLSLLLPESLTPDPLASGAAAFTALLFAMGLERSRALRLLLNSSIVLSVIFFVGAGATHCEPDIWRSHAFLPAGTAGLLTGAALSCTGFLGTSGVGAESARVWARSCGPRGGPSRRLELAASLLVVGVATCSYLAVTLVLTLMVNFRTLGAESPALVQAFEVRDVDWARLVMAMLGICALALALIEVASPLHRVVRALAADGLLPRALARPCALTGTGAAAILVSGACASLLALLLPVATLLQVAAGSALLINTVTAAAATLQRFQPNPEDGPNQAGEKATSGPSLKCLRSSLGAIPAAVRRAGEACRWSGRAAGNEEERAHLFAEQEDSAGATLQSSAGQYRRDSSSDLSGYETDSSGSTDIDAVVAEFKEKIKVATLGDYAPEAAVPDPVTARRASLALAGALIAGTLTAALLLVVMDKGWQTWPGLGLLLSSLLSTGLLGVAARQPQSSVRLLSTWRTTPSATGTRPQQPRELEVRVPLSPWLPSLAVLLHVTLLLQLLAVAWMPLLLAAAPGLCAFALREWRLYRRSGVRHGGERIRLRSPPLQSARPTLVPSHQRLPQHAQGRLTRVDTILITR